MVISRFTTWKARSALSTPTLPMSAAYDSYGPDCFHLTFRICLQEKPCKIRRCKSRSREVLRLSDHTKQQGSHFLLRLFLLKFHIHLRLSRNLKAMASLLTIWSTSTTSLETTLPLAQTDSVLSRAAGCACVRMELEESSVVKEIRWPFQTVARKTQDKREVGIT